MTVSHQWWRPEVKSENHHSRISPLLTMNVRRAMYQSHACDVAESIVGGRCTDNNSFSCEGETQDSTLL